LLLLIIIYNEEINKRHFERPPTHPQKEIFQNLRGNALFPIDATGRN
jgi:hypothetical protein